MYLVTFERSHKQQHCTVPCFAGFVKKPDDVRYWKKHVRFKINYTCFARRNSVFLYPWSRVILNKMIVFSYLINSLTSREQENLQNRILSQVSQFSTLTNILPVFSLISSLLKLILYEQIFADTTQFAILKFFKAMVHQLE